MKKVRITSDGTSVNTKIVVEGLELTRVKHLLDAEGLGELQLTMFVCPGELELDLDGELPVEAKVQR